MTVFATGAGAGLAAAVLLVGAAPAAAEDGFNGAMIGPHVGVTWGNGKRASGIYGLEAGFGWNVLLRANAGLTMRDGEAFAYAELDGWYILGVTLGMGYGTRSEWSPVLGVWEALPLWVDDETCDSATVISLSAGYRWTGMHELYLGGKYGEMPWFCFD